jgi:hypothetical protein
MGIAWAIFIFTIFSQLKKKPKVREDFYFIDWFHGSAHHGSRCVASCNAHTNFAVESACQTPDNF